MKEGKKRRKKKDRGEKGKTKFREREVGGQRGKMEDIRKTEEREGRKRRQSRKMEERQENEERKGR
jgi:hypothetical protein